MRHIALDTETTGIGPEHHRLIEIAAVEFDPATGLPTGNNFYTLLNPQRDIPAEATAVHGKTLEDLKDQPLFADVVPSLLEFIADANVVIHNQPFDEGFLNAECKRAKQPLISKVATKLTDTLAVSRRHVKAKTHTLDALCTRYGIDLSARTLHGALIDCELLAAVYPELMREAQASRERVNAILSFRLDDAVPERLDDMVARHLELAELIKLLESEQKRHTEAIKGVVAGADTEGTFFSVEFANRTTTDWEKVTREHLKDVDLAPYRKTGSAMYVRHR